MNSINDTKFKIPFYAKSALIFISVFAFIYSLYIAHDIIIPLVFAIIIAILMNPLVNFLVRKKFNRTLAISLAVLLAIIIGLCMLYVISSQVTMLAETFPQLKIKLASANVSFLHWASEKLNIAPARISNWMNEAQSDLVRGLANGETLSQMGHIGVMILLLPAYVFMILFYKPLLLEFIRMLFMKQYHSTVIEVLLNSKKIIQGYLIGLFFELVIISVMNAAGLLLLGIDYAIILGITGAILNIIPYIGGIVAVILPMVIAFITKDSLIYPLLVLIIYLVTQFIDNHYISPSIVASRVKINALISVIAVLTGGALWGIPGMFLSIPITAILKVIFDHIEPLKPVGFLLGNIVPVKSRFSFVKGRL